MNYILTNPTLIFFLGMLFAFAIVFLTMPSMMILKRKSKFSFDETIKKISDNVKKENWSLLAVRRLDESVKKHGCKTDVKVALIEICEATLANAIISDKTATQMSVMMPCTISVYENADGTVYIANMNTAPMGFMFGGIVRKVMVGKVSPAQKRILNI